MDCVWVVDYRLTQDSTQIVDRRWLICDVFSNQATSVCRDNMSATFPAKLFEDRNLWADLSPVDFGNWLGEETTKSRDDGHQGKTSYELMMAVFGEKSGSKDRILEEPSLAAWTATTPPATTPPNKKAIPPTKNARLVRMSRLQKISEVTRKRLLKSSSLQGKYWYTMKAT